MNTSSFTKQDKITALQKLLNDVELRAKRRGLPFQKTQLFGRKRELLTLARKVSSQLIRLQEGSLEKYMALLGYCFPRPNRHLKNMNLYQALFPEYFIQPSDIGKTEHGLQGPQCVSGVTAFG